MSIDKITELLTTADDVVREYREAREAAICIENELQRLRDAEHEAHMKLTHVTTRLRKATQAMQEHFDS